GGLLLIKIDAQGDRARHGIAPPFEKRRCGLRCIGGVRWQPDGAGCGQAAEQKKHKDCKLRTMEKFRSAFHGCIRLRTTSKMERENNFACIKLSFLLRLMAASFAKFAGIKALPCSIAASIITHHENHPLPQQSR